MDDSSFYSLDKLVEFGMGTTVATQMAKFMNESMSNMAVPGVQNQMTGKDGYGNACAATSDNLYYVAIDGKAAGPFAPSELSQLVADKKLTSKSYVWCPGMKDWERAEEVNDILKIVALTPPPVPPAD